MAAVFRRHQQKVLEVLSYFNLEDILEIFLLELDILDYGNCVWTVIQVSPYFLNS